MVARKPPLAGLTGLVMVFAVLTGASAAAAATSVEMPVVGTLAGGLPQDVVIQGDYAYVAAQGALSIFDISNPSNPVQVGFYDTPGSAEGVAVVTMGIPEVIYAFVADWYAGLRVIDVSDPTAPVKVGSASTSGYAYGVAVSGSYAYVADHAAGLCVIDISDLANPVAVGSCDTPGYAWDVAVDGDYAYVADGVGGLQILDVTSPTSPVAVAFCPALDSVNDVAVVGDYAYVADGESGLRVIDVSDPTDPGCDFATLDTPGEALGVFVAGDRAYVADGEAGLQVVDISDPGDPVLLGSVDTPGTATGVAGSGEVVYVADDIGGLRAIDVSTLPTPTVVGQVQTPGNAEAAAVEGVTAYVADGPGGLRAFDVSNPTAPSEVWSCASLGEAMDVAVAGDYAYVADWNAGLRIVGIVSPTAPACSVGFAATPGHPSGVAVSGDDACVAVGTAGLSVVDVSDPANPSVVFTLDTPGSANDVAVSGNYAYVADGSAGLQILDIVTPTGPVASVATSGYAWGVAHAGGVVYLASGSAGLELIDVANPLAPVKRSSLPIPGSAHGVDVAGKYAYVTAGGYGVVVIDVSNPLAPQIIASCGTPSGPGPSEVAVLGGYAYVADAEAGLVVIDILPPYSELAAYETPGYCQGMAVLESGGGSALAYIADGPAGVRVVQASDASDPTDPALVGTNRMFADATDVAISGNYGYVTDYNNGLSVIGASNPTDPYTVGWTDTPGSALGVAVKDPWAYVADGNEGLRVISVVSKTAPDEKVFWNTPGWARRMALTTIGGTAYALVADGHTGLRVIDISTIAQQTDIFSDDFESGLSGWTTNGTVEWSSSQPKIGNYAVRLSNTGSIEQRIATTGYADIAVSFYLGASLDDPGEYVLGAWFDGTDWNQLAKIDSGAANEDGALHYYAIQLPAEAADNANFSLRFVVNGNENDDRGYVDQIVVKGSQIRLHEVGFYNTPGQARDVAVGADNDGNIIACVADGAAGLRLIDISLPAAPTEVGSLDTPGWAESVVASGHVALVADGESGVRVIDFSEPTAPVELAYYDTPGWASDAAVLRGHAYVGDTGWGLIILGMWHSFPDVLFDYWAYREIEAAAAVGIVQGYPFEDPETGETIYLYQPSWEVYRDQMAVFVARAHAGGDANVPSYEGAPAYFADVLPDHWAWKYIMYCRDHGIVAGYRGADGRSYYRPWEAVTRDQMTVYIARAKGWIAIGENMAIPEQLFPDVWANFWCGAAIKACMGENPDGIVVVKGYADGYFRPYVRLTRDQMAVFIARAFALLI